MTRARAPASHGQRVRKWDRSEGVITIAAKLAAPQISIECLFKRPTPATAPRRSQLFAAPRPAGVAARRRRRNAAPVQKSCSKAGMFSICAMRRYAGAVIAAVPARSCAKAPPPSRFARRAVRKMVRPPARTAGRRIAQSA